MCIKVQYNFAIIKLSFLSVARKCICVDALEIGVSQKITRFLVVQSEYESKFGFMNDPAFWHRMQFAFTITYHYLFPQLTMGLAWFLVYWKWQALRTGNEKYNQAVRFWARIFALNFAVGVVTGIPMEFQFGTNWAGFSKYSGSVIGQTLAMEGMFAFFLESAFIGALIFGEKRLSPRVHFLTALGVALGSWGSGYFIIATNAFMQHPVGYEMVGNAPNQTLGLANISEFLLNPWAWIQFSHNQCAALVTGSFAITALGAFYTLRNEHREQAGLYLRSGTLAGLFASCLVALPTGDQQAKMVARYQPVTLAAMEAHFHGGDMAGIAVIGQPNLAEQRLDNPIVLPGALSFLANGTFESYVHGLDEYPPANWPDNIELLYYAFHLMVTLGSIFILLMLLANIQRFRGKLEASTWLLWPLLLAFPFPYIANTLGWMTTELGRQPWLIYNLYRTSQGYSQVVSDGDVIFTLIGFCGLYLAVGVMFLFMVAREIIHGPDPEAAHAEKEDSHD
jgi:cytochrome d ubiquinol oxidase subunit I